MVENPDDVWAEISAKIEADRKKFEAETTAFVSYGEPVTIARAREVFEKYHPAPHWKDPVNARGVPYADLDVFLNAILFYHGGAKPRVKPEKGNGVTDCGYHVTNNGYAC